MFVFALNNSAFNTSSNGSLAQLVLVASEDSSARSFDRELVQNVTLHVIATDRGGHEATRDILVNVLDVNDNEPHFVGNQVFNLQVDTRALVASRDDGTLVLHELHAEDADAGLNGLVRYDFFYSNEEIESTFALNRTSGRIVVRSVASLAAKPVWHLSVLASDRAQPASARRSSVAVLNVRVLNSLVASSKEADAVASSGNGGPSATTHSAIYVRFLHVAGLVKPRLLTKHRLKRLTNAVEEEDGDDDDDVNDTHQDIVYMATSVPANTTIGFALVVDHDESDAVTPSFTPTPRRSKLTMVRNDIII